MEYLVDDLMEAKKMVTRTRMRLVVETKSRGKITLIVSMIRTIEIREEEEEGNELEEDVFVEIFFTV